MYGSSSGQGSAIQKAPEPPRGIGEHQQELRGLIDGVAKRLCDLESRISPILQPVPPSTEASGSAPQPVRSTLLDAVVCAKQDVARLGQHIESLLNRIEL